MLPALQSVDSLAVRCPNWVGDIVMATPVFECLRSNFPTATITALIRPYARGILEDAPWFDHIVDCQDKDWQGLKTIRQEFARLKPQFGLLLTNTTHSFLTFKFAALPRTYGYRRNLRKFLLTGGPNPIMEEGEIKPIPMQDYYLDLCRYLDLEIPTSPKPTLYISDTLASQGANRLKNYGIEAGDTVIGLNPGASFGSSKCWPTEYFAELAEQLQDRFGGKLLLLVGPGEEAIADRIIQASNAEIINTAKDRIDLAHLKPLIKRCNLLITNDTGPRHYAVAFDVPHIVLMGPTNAIYTANNLQMATVLQRQLPCVPCHKKTCPLGHHACMNEITPAMVIEAANNYLGHR
ncbi:MAG: lipopolysaccharide heptosyltransferase II [Pseudomonadota bacterium]|nr:lipopolysaccharide heptosyltransferase II [Pseudomonadota bacterium]MEE3172224.1 lipopolysaccharide heptosyltransferase II [Pseudomonadota bacterium]